jgi:hypothetical protein
MAVFAVHFNLDRGARIGAAAGGKARRFDQNALEL